MVFSLPIIKQKNTFGKLDELYYHSGTRYEEIEIPFLEEHYTAAQADQM